MKWIELSININREIESLVTSLLVDFGSSGVVIEDPEELTKERQDQYGEIYDLNPDDYPEEGIRVKCYFNELDFSETLQQNIEQAILNLDDADQNFIQLHVKHLQESDWENEWKHYFHPFKASKHFTIVPSWEDYETQDTEEKCIELDPGMAFGTGDHPTTYMCLSAIEDIVKPEHSVIDVGTGSGVLSIASHLMGAKRIKAIDLDQMAVNVAVENFEKNNCAQDIEAATGNLLKEETGKYDVIIANILAHIIEQMIEDAYDKLNDGGYFITSGIIIEKSNQIIEQLKRVGFKHINLKEDNGWVCIVCQKVSE
ncbi:50S ribosomal protein L11 methyltransferase [Staphylococcus massiliensis]|uniref:Ribosomal protein L11 methyltransferase n=1 Tax=Staphylococcus massiliensis S46 TaxID=1229783 RepID=K9AR72_9STAP|nr:50S ribosomal protein L11 methyltransferase [Staphylococcus massiliensis]EKU49918.1 ribosomal protein L11 methyltransferase [Staphylococcus massiliensis S46]MCG3399022.1 50S ribosomal protein L11 methyltransferase [Staphylococcus massiliensis]MCG3400980.1 50S ribosomal protein L11 methyltransferase [Staphylococcus massiliensis]MCG3412515.1 50S ribosomal protein L11 methyltransferase [Staphylococcus massiliensis]PNZ98917.1 50S ribosomal protein L11 methyltransferase [Staphylococcus massilien